MKLLLKLGAFDNQNDRQVTVDWDKGLMEFPQYVKYDDRFWGWIFHDSDSTSVVDRVLVFGEYKEEALPVDLNNKPFPVADLEKLFNLNPMPLKECECGQKDVPYAKHSGYCPRNI